MRKNKIRIAITGATGLLGRNLLFEIIKQNLINLNSIEIFVMGRSKDDMSLQHRVQQIIKEDGVYYICANKEQAEDLEDFCKYGIKYIQMDLDRKGLDIEQEDYRKLKSSPIDMFFHVGALTDLRHSSAVIMALKKTNVNGTAEILRLVSSLNVGEFCYVGTAYACGQKSGNIKPDYINMNQEFRSPYEKSKLEAEILVRKFAKKTGIRCRYFRPSVTCGRLIESPLGSINKFDVFYAWGAFFLRIKLEVLKNWNDRYKDPANLDIRVCFNAKSGLNIVPVDYIAKVLYQVCSQKDGGESYHIVNNEETPHSLYTSLILDIFNIKGWQQVAKIPEKKNYLESLYYKTAGKIFTPYTIYPSLFFDTSSLSKVLVKAKLHCPAVDKNNLLHLFDYAKNYDFGLNLKGMPQNVVSCSG